MQPVNLNRLAYFAAVVDAASFTRAADRLGITKTVVSQQVARLEQELKTSLLVRTTRRVEPTEAGRLLHARCVMILREAEAWLNYLKSRNLTSHTYEPATAKIVFESAKTFLGDARFLLMVACAFVMGLVGTLASGALMHLG